MKHRLLPVTILVLAACGLWAQQQVRVTAARQLPNALRSNTTVTLATGTYLTSEVNQASNPAVSWEKTFDGLQLVVTGVKGLTIKAAAGAPRGAALLAKPRYSYTVVFRQCRDLVLEGLTLGHTEAGECEGGVLRLEECTNVQVVDCDLFGSGVVGMDVEECTGITVRGSTIRDCTAGALWALGSKDLRFQEVRIAGNEGWPLVSVEESKNVVFDSCTIEGNTGDAMVWVSQDSAGVAFPRTTFRGNHADALQYEDGAEPDFSNTSFIDNVFGNGGDGEEEVEGCDCEGEYEQGYQEGYDQGYEEGWADAMGEAGGD